MYRKILLYRIYNACVPIGISDRGRYISRDITTYLPMYRVRSNAIK